MACIQIKTKTKQKLHVMMKNRGKMKITGIIISENAKVFFGIIEQSDGRCLQLIM